jgi:hypothetical protein
VLRTSYLVLLVILISVGATSAYAINITLGGSVFITQILDMMGNRITNVGAPTEPSDAATKGYVDSAPGTDTLALLGCTTDQIARWTGSVWTCSTINSSPGPITLDEGGRGLSLAVVNGNPAISYRIHSGDLNYFRANDVKGEIWSDPVTVDTGSVDRSSLAVVNGKPAISYLDVSNQILRYVQANDINGETWKTPLTIGNPLGYQTKSTLQVVNGKPAIVYQNLTGVLNITYVQATDSDGITWGTPTVIDVGNSFSFAVINNKPAVSYNDGNGTLKFIQAIDADGITWGTPTVIDGALGVIATLAEVNGKPAITFRNNTLVYVQAIDANGTNWRTPTVVDSRGGQYVSFAVVNGNPAISYAEDNVYVKFIRSSDIDGSNWNKPVRIDVGEQSGYEPSLALVDGKPAVAYIEDPFGEFLLYSVARDADGTNWSPGISFEP